MYTGVLVSKTDVLGSNWFEGVWCQLTCYHVEESKGRWQACLDRDVWHSTLLA